MSEKLTHSEEAGGFRVRKVYEVFTAIRRGVNFCGAARHAAAEASTTRIKLKLRDDPPTGRLLDRPRDDPF